MAGTNSQTLEVAATNRLSAAMYLLRQFYTMTGRPDLTETPSKGTKEDEQKAAPGEEEPTGEAITPTVPLSVVEDLSYLLLDNTEGAYFTRDLVSTDELVTKFSVSGDPKSPSYDGIENYVQIFYEPEVGPADVASLPFYRNETGAATPPVQVEPPEGETPPPESAGGAQPLSIKAMVAKPATDGSVFNVNEDPMVSDRYLQPTLSAFVFPNHRIGPSTRSAGATALFVNAIPSVEMSRCTPHIKVTFVAAVPYGIGQRTRQLSILRFLGMNSDDGTYDKINMRHGLPENMAPGPVDLSLNKAEKAEKALKDAKGPGEGGIATLSTSVSAAGMELFTSPQTMVNANINNEDDGFSGGSGTILDPFLPLMTLEKLSIRISGLGQALHANKTGSLSFILHDRSRMADIAPLLAVDLFSQTHLVIEWGWNHPDGNNPVDNAYGALLHAMKSVGAFNIVASNWTIGNDGQVRVDMSLASRGASEIKAFPIATGRLMPVTPFKNMLTSYLAKKLEIESAKTLGVGSEQVQKNNLAEIRSKINLSMNNASSPSTVIGRDKWAEFLTVLDPPKDATVDPAALTKLLEELVGDPVAGDPGLTSISNDSLTAEVSSKTSAMLETLDPFFPGAINRHIAEALSDGATDNYISLGKLFMTFVGTPLAGSSRFDEVQMMFYRFNTNAGAARNLDSIANFLVDKTDFQMTMETFSRDRPSMSIEGFANFINTNILSSPSDVNYGLTALKNEITEAQQKAAKANKSKDETVKSEIQQQVAQLNDQVESRLKEIYMDGPPCKPEFVVPKLSMMIESLPAFVPGESDDAPSFQVDQSKVILRVHVFDQNASPHTDEMFLISCMNDSDMAVQMQTSSDTATAEAAKAEEGVTKPEGKSATKDKQKEEGTIVAPESKTGYEVYTSTIPNSEMKRIIKNTVPSLTYGQGFSALTNFSMRSTTGGSVQAAMMVNAIKDAPSKPGSSKGETSNMEDVTVIPANASMSLLGCPLFEYGQQFFVDLGTGTTADNMYRVIGVEHNLSSGEFTTNVNLGFNGSGTMSVFRSIIAAALPGLQAESAEPETPPAGDEA
jgi:hypothetical protein